MLTAGEVVKTGLKSNGEGAEKWRKLDKQGCKRFHCDSSKGQKGLMKRGRLSTSSRFSYFYHSLHQQPSLLLFLQIDLNFPQFLCKNGIIFLCFVLSLLTAFLLPLYNRRHILLLLKSFSDSLLSQCSIKH